MEAFLTFFEQMPSWQRAMWVIICLVANWNLEGKIPLFQFDYSKWKHAGVNFVFLATSFIINVLFGVITVGIFLWIEQNQFGLLYYLSWPIWMELLLAVMMLDLIAQYLVHYLLHKIKWMWRLHMIHHSDSKVDTTTATRHHPGDYLIRELFALFTILILGAPIAFYIFYRILTIFFAYFTHANIAMPMSLDRPLSWIIVTPNMHKFHHHFKRPWTDTNFGSIFSLWDRIFGTLVYEAPGKVHYGLDVLDDSSDEDILYQLKLPFERRMIKKDSQSE